jgi:glyoxylase-like metal-dependent hydrolase (beta-lactamase superfamily II)
METFSIIPLKVGEFKGIERSNLTYQLNPGQKLVAPIIMYLIKGRDKLILVDTGPSDEAWAEKYHHGMVQTEDMKPQNALKKAGVGLEDIDLVVNTHLHWDHSFNNRLFKKTKIFVQKKEMQYAICPLPPHWVYYESFQLGLTSKWLEAMTNIVAVDGDVELLPGIKLVTLPGHTPGMQGVLVESTIHGRTLVASDCCGLFENWTGSGIHKHIPSGIHIGLPEYYETFEKMDRLCDFVLPGHDPDVFLKNEY